MLSTRPTRNTWFPLKRGLLVLSLALYACRVEETPSVAPASTVEAQPAPVQAPPSVEEPEPSPEPVGPPILASTVSSEAADALAGLSSAGWDEGRAKIALDAYAYAIADDWTRWEEKVGTPMLVWSAENLPSSKGKTVFYPFSGPDFPTVHRMYPDATRYILVAMQKGGPPPEPESLKMSHLEETLDVYAEVFANYTRKGFFITNEMNEKFTKDHHPVKGLTGLLMAFAAREGYLVESVEPIWISRDAKVETDPGDRRRLRTWDSVRLHLIRRADGVKVTLDYLRLNLADRRIKERPYAMTWVQDVAGELVFVKAASHLMQQTNFAFIRNALLDNAQALLQDESGVGYARLKRKHDVTLFGSFKKVNRLFKEEPQEPLAAAYRTGKDVRDLPFRIGYLKAAGSCLQLGLPKDQSVQGQANPPTAD